VERRSGVQPARVDGLDPDRVTVRVAPNGIRTTRDGLAREDTAGRVEVVVDLKWTEAEIARVPRLTGIGGTALST